MIPAWVLNMIGGVLGAIALFLLRRTVSRADALEARITGLELTMARDLPNKEDMGQVWQRLDRVDNTLSEVRDMVIRLEERGKIHDRE